MIDFESLLNKEQCEAATCNSKYTRVVAGAGSGKTRVLTYRIAYLLENEHVPPQSIMAVTFTNKAAKEIKERVTSTCGNAYGMFLGTIHSWCARFLRFNAEHIGYPRNFTILDDDDQLNIMKFIFHEKHGLPKSDPNIKKCLEWIGGKKMRGYEYEDLQNEKYPNPIIQSYLGYFKEYTDILFERKSLDFDDLLLKSIDVLELFKEKGIKLSNNYDHILIDEFQDINDVQFKLISLLMDEYSSLYVVGDPDQTIYTWRGANHKLILDLEESLKYMFKNAKVNTITLDRNYRSTKNILEAANRLINKNTERLEKNLYTLGDQGEEIKVFNARTQREESTDVVTSIIDLHKRRGVEYKDIAVLYRANYLTRDLESILNMYRVPYKVFGGMKFYQRKEIKDIVAYFRLIINEYDDTSFERIVNVPARGIGPGTMEKLIKAAGENGQTLYLYLKENINECPLSAKQRVSWINVIEQMKIVQKEIASDNRELTQVLEDFIDNIGYYDYLYDEEEEDKADERKQNIKSLIANVNDFLREDTSVTFEDFVNNAMLQAAQDDVSDGDYVSLMTVHTAKGLEFDYVFVYGFNDGVFPSERSATESKKGMEEERRLAYVAFTRAKKKLYLSSNQDYSFVLQSPSRPSRFIKEAGLAREESKSRFIYERPQQPVMYKAQGLVKKDISAKPIVTSNQTNGVTSWKVGDRINHSTHGDGTVVEIIDKLIVVELDDKTKGKKTFLGNHIAIKKI